MPWNAQHAAQVCGGENGTEMFYEGCICVHVVCVCLIFRLWLYNLGCEDINSWADTIYWLAGFWPSEVEYFCHDFYDFPFLPSCLRWILPT